MNQANILMWAHNLNILPSPECINCCGMTVVYFCIKHDVAYITNTSLILKRISHIFYTTFGVCLRHAIVLLWNRTLDINVLSKSSINSLRWGRLSGGFSSKHNTESGTYLVHHPHKIQNSTNLQYAQPSSESSRSELQLLVKIAKNKRGRRTTTSSTLQIHLSTHQKHSLYLRRRISHIRRWFDMRCTVCHRICMKTMRHIYKLNIITTLQQN